MIMKKCGIVSLIFSLIVSLAAPAGAVFAMDEVEGVTEEDIISTDKEAIVAVNVAAEIPEAQIESVETAVSEMTQATLVDETGAETASSPQPTVTTAADAPIVAEPVTTPPAIITLFDVSSTLEFVEMYNQSGSPLDISKLTLKYSAGNQACETAVNDTGYVLPAEYFLVVSPTSASREQRTFTAECLFDGDVTRVEVFYEGNRIQLIDQIGSASSQWMAHKSAWYFSNSGANKIGDRKSFSVIKQSGSFEADYSVIAVGVVEATGLRDSDMYHPPDSTDGLMIVEILSNSRSCSPGDMGEDCEDYIKLYNSSDKPVDLAKYRIRTGARTANATTTTSYTWHEPTIHPYRDELILTEGSYFTLRMRNDGVALSLANKEGNIWIEDYFGVVSYQEVSYAGMDLAAARDRTWAYDETDGTWKFGLASPDKANMFPMEEVVASSTGDSTLKPCRDDQYRSEETNRCRNISTGSTLAPCKEGQYRSEETNRCRSIASAAASVLKPCADDQFRNPETNRCKKIASAEELADCGEGRERNPETNRCRNVRAASMPLAPFAAEQVTQTAQGTLGWWVFGGASLLAVGYAGWQWRFEMGRLARKVRGAVLSGPKE